jgi:transposase-like protein
VDACVTLGAVGSLLRREGLYSSLLTTWRRQRDDGALAGLSTRKRGRRAGCQHPLAKRVAQLEREKRDLELRLKKAELLIDIQKKVSLVLGLSLEPPASGEPNS